MNGSTAGLRAGEAGATVEGNPVLACAEAVLEHGYSRCLVIAQAPPLDEDTLLQDLVRARKMFDHYER